MRKNRVYNERVIYLAARMWATGIDVSEVARQMNIPDKTVRYWITNLRKRGLTRPRKLRKQQMTFERIVKMINSEMRNSDSGKPADQKNA